MPPVLPLTPAVKYVAGDMFMSVPSADAVFLKVPTAIYVVVDGNKRSVTTSSDIYGLFRRKYLRPCSVGKNW